MWHLWSQHWSSLLMLHEDFQPSDSALTTVITPLNAPSSLQHGVTQPTYYSNIADMPWCVPLFPQPDVQMPTLFQIPPLLGWLPCWKLKSSECCFSSLRFSFPFFFPLFFHHAMFSAEAASDLLLSKWVACHGRYNSGWSQLLWSLLFHPIKIWSSPSLSAN